MDWTPAVLDRVIALRQGRMSWPAIAQQLDVSRSALLCAVQRSGRSLPMVGTVMPATRGRPAPRCDAVAEETLESRNARGARATAVAAKIRPYIVETDAWSHLRDRPKCEADHWGKPCGRALYRDTGTCLGHKVLALRHEYRNEYLPQLALLTGSATPRRLAAAIRARIETRGLTLAQWSAEVGMAQSTAYKAVMAPDDHPRSFERIANAFGFDYYPMTGTYRRRKP